VQPSSVQHINKKESADLFPCNMSSSTQEETNKIFSKEVDVGASVQQKEN
jgi:hypothetical protein